MKALIVEDDPPLLQLLSLILRARGHEVTACGRAEDGFLAYQQGGHELVLTDLSLPGMDGLELCRSLRALPGGDRSLVLVVTARSGHEDLQRVLEAGADDYLAKPVDLKLLGVRLDIGERRLRDRLERKSAEAELAASLARLEASNDDLHAVLRSLRVGTALVDGSGDLTFLNEVARKVLTGRKPLVLPTAWEAAVPLSDAARAALVAMALLPVAAREKLPVTLDASDGRHYRMEIEVQDDPRNPASRIYLLYDVSEVHDLRVELEQRVLFHSLTGQSRAMRQIYQQIQQLSGVDATVLIEGETGTGKELVARAIHYSSKRRHKPFVAINCAGLTESLLASQLFGHRKGAFTGAIDDHQGVFEFAEGGTLLLDEIGDISMEVQKSLLRVLQERELTRVGDSRPRKIDVRVLVATHRDLVKEVAAGRFRADLMYRIRVARVAIPPLCKRRDDIPVLVAEFLRQCCLSNSKVVQDVSPQAMAQLLAYPWPGNVRELRSAIEYAVIRCEGSVVEVADLPPEFSGELEGAAPVAVAEDDEERLAAALAAAKGKRAVAARLLGVSRATLYRRLAARGTPLKDS